ncbi:MAG: DUF86 domain-containing protein [Flavobacteriales bacterium]|nr:hypothetical protein [Flavobacteriales bacterium]MCC6575890.1 DUF86 domain-containing protein [Flavobacteriales bacterium]NUQ14151.1 DUF86 domain-containing protein [Flavobacteriales bacterium]
MSERSDKVRLVDMLQAAEKVVRSMAEVDLEAFLADEDLRDATVYRLQIIGEAAYNVSDVLKQMHPEVDWFKIQGLRHRIVHDYAAIDDTQIFRITNKYVPPLVEQLKKILEAGVE